MYVIDGTSIVEINIIFKTSFKLMHQNPLILVICPRKQRDSDQVTVVLELILFFERE